MAERRVGSVRTLVAERLTELETRLRDLAELRDELRVLLRDWDQRLARTPGGAQARLLDVLADRPVVDRAVARQQRTIGSANLRRRLERRDPAMGHVSLSRALVIAIGGSRPGRWRT